MGAPIVGGCMCGAVRYEISAEPIAFAVCHCRECQYVSGGAAGHVLVLPAAAIHLKQGKLKGFASKTDTGNTVTRQFCPECGTPVFSDPSAMPTIRVVKVGTLDDRNRFEPTLTLWTQSAPDWAHIDPELPAFEKNPPAPG